MIKKLLLVAVIFFSLKSTVANTPPTLSNFRIENANKNRVYFDSNEPISASTTSGFIINGKVISSISINSGQVTDHYFTVSSSFTFWDNNTIRYEGGSNLKDEQGNDLYEFTLAHIVNNINEPSTSKNIYVNASASGSNNGTSEANAFTTLEAAVSSISGGGNRILVKAGNYSGENIKLPSSGSSSSPNVIEGYKSNPGDISMNYYDYTPRGGTPNLNSSEMPVFTGSSRESSGGIFIEDGSDWIIKNIQVQNYNQGMIFDSSYNIVIENVNVINIGSTQIKDNEGYGISMYDWIQQAGYFRVKNTFVINATGDAFYTLGNYSLFENCEAYTNEYDSADAVLETTDYYFVSQASNNIFKNCTAWKDTPTGAGHNGHGFSIKGLGNQSLPNEYNLVTDCLAVNILGAYQLRHPNTKYNVIKNSEAHADIPNRTPGSNQTSGIEFLSGNSDNIIENMYIHHVDNGVNMVQNSENPSSVVAENNIMRNSIITNVEQVFRFGTVYGSCSIQDFMFYNNTIVTADNLNWMDGSGISVTMDITNNIINDVNRFNRSSSVNGQTFSNSNIYNSWTNSLGSSSVNVNPLLDSNYKLTDLSPIEVKEGGKTLTEVLFDMNGLHRSASYSIGAYEYQDGSTSSINANAGSDVFICNGESTTLNATGGTSYSWNTGETTASITVNPSETTTYSVTVSDETNSDTDYVVVTVNEPPTVNAGSDVSICSGENVTLTASGEGNFLWNTGETTSSITVNPSVTQTFTVTTSNSCDSTATDQVTVNVSPGVILDAGTDVSICNGESTTLTASGNGDFLWSTGETSPSITVNPTTTTTYSVTSSLGDCSKTEEVIVSVNQSPTVNAGSDVSICSGENVTLTASGEGNLLWNTGETTSSITVSPTTTTTYTVTASNSCDSNDASDSIIVTVNNKPALNVSSNVTIENGESTTLSATGNGNFLWNTGETTSSITVSPAGTTSYVVSLTSSNGCTVQDTIIVTVTNDESVVTADAGSDQEICLYEEIILTATGGGTYLWSTGETTDSITVSPTETTTYTVTVSNGSDIDVDDVVVFVDQGCSAIGSRSIIKEIKLYPNPTHGLIHIELAGMSDELNLSIIDLNGRQVYSEIIDNYAEDKVLKRQINLNRFGKGVYIVRIVNFNSSETKKILVI